MSFESTVNLPQPTVNPSFSGTRSPPRPLLRRRSTIKLLYGPGIASPGLALSQDIVHMGSLYNVHTDTEPPRARPGPSRPSSASGGPPAAARCGGVTNPTTEHRDAVGRSEVQLGVCIAHPGLSPGPINTRLRRRGHEVLFTPGQAFMQYGFGNTLDKTLTAVVGCKERGRQVDGPLDHSTGKGWVKDHAYGNRGVILRSGCLLYTSPSPRDGLLSRMPSSA